MAERLRIGLKLTADGTSFKRGLEAAGRDSDKFRKKQERNAKAGQRAEERASKARGRARSRFGGKIKAGINRGLNRGIQATGIAAILALNKIRGFEKGLADLMITGRKQPKWMDGARSTIEDISNSTGKSKEEVLSYLAVWTQMKGTLDEGQKALKGMAQVAVATGAPMSTLAKLMAAMNTQFGVTADRGRAVMNTLRIQEKLGKVTFGQVSSEFGRLAPAAQDIGGKNEETIRGLGATFQIVARGFDPSKIGEAAGAMQRFMQNLKLNAKKVEKTLGIDIGKQTKKGFKFKGFEEVIKTIGFALNKSKTPVKDMKKLFGVKGLQAAAQIRLAAQAWKGSGAAALFGAGTGDRDEIQTDLNKRKATKSFTLTQSLNKISNLMQKHLLPAFQWLADNMGNVASVIRTLADNARLVGAAILSWKLLGLVGSLNKAAAATGVAQSGLGKMGRGILGLAALAPVLVAAFLDAKAALEGGFKAKEKFKGNVKEQIERAKGRGDKKEVKLLKAVRDEAIAQEKFGGSGAMGPAQIALLAHREGLASKRQDTETRNAGIQAPQTAAKIWAAGGSMLEAAQKMETAVNAMAENQRKQGGDSDKVLVFGLNRDDVARLKARSKDGS